LTGAQNPNILLLQETMGDVEKIYGDFGKLLAGREFIHSNARGRLGGLFSRWII
jgi:hypothetical protein